MRVKGYLVLVLVLDWTKCLSQVVGAPPAMLPGRTGGFPKKLGGRAPERQGRWIQFAQSVAHQPRAGCISLVLLFSMNRLRHVFKNFALIHSYPIYSSTI